MHYRPKRISSWPKRVQSTTPRVMLCCRVMLMPNKRRPRVHEYPRLLQGKFPCFEAKRVISNARIVASAACISYHALQETYPGSLDACPVERFGMRPAGFIG